MRLPLKTYLYSAAAAAVVQSRLRVYYFVCSTQVLCIVLCPPLRTDPNDATNDDGDVTLTRRNENYEAVNVKENENDCEQVLWATIAQTCGLRKE